MEAVNLPKTCKVTSVGISIPSKRRKAGPNMNSLIGPVLGLFETIILHSNFQVIVFSMSVPSSSLLKFSKFYSPGLCIKEKGKGYAVFGFVEIVPIINQWTISRGLLQLHGNSV